MARILITGASSGIGQAAALQLAGAHEVIATVRSDDACRVLLEQADQAGVHLDVALLDVTDFGAVDGLITSLVEAGGIDVLIQNAGAGHVGTTEELDFDELRACMELNFFAAAHIVQAALPSMRARHRGRIIVVTSVGGVVGQPFNDAYCAAKFAIEGLLESLHPIAGAVGVQVTVLEPGPVATKFIDNLTGLESVFAGGDAPYAAEKAAYMARLGSPERLAGMQTADEVAQVVVDLVEADDPPFRAQTSAWSTEFIGIKLSDLDGRATTLMTGSWVTTE
jgi:short-subunit dehydrogenase